MVYCILSGDAEPKPLQGYIHQWISIIHAPTFDRFFQKNQIFLPVAFNISSNYLDAQYTEILGNINKQIEEAKYIHLQCDSWSNLKNESIINFIFSKSVPIFIDFVMTKSNSHNAEYLAQLIINVMDTRKVSVGDW